MDNNEPKAKKKTSAGKQELLLAARRISHV